ncbi:MAG TPA: hypothetical protein PK849_08110 [Synergistales bacterium]|nr:hypothetical protein [Synergistales bacterium]
MFSTTLRKLRAARLALLLTLFFACSGEAAPILYIVRIPLVLGEEAQAVLPDGKTIPLGKVAALPTSSRWPGYTASKWAPTGSVAASAVNAVHLTLSVEKEKGRTVSILPRHTVAPAAGEQSFIALDSPAGTGFFGGWAPPVATPVLVRRNDGALVPLEERGLPREGDTLIFEVSESESPYLIDIENRPGGRVLGWYESGPRLLARVIRPLKGVGRFGGTEFQNIGRIRANHSGVIDVSTTPRGVVGGFQILPFLHSKSQEMSSAWQLTQWLIIASPTDRPLPGTAPLFSSNLVPGSQMTDVLWDMWSTYGRKPLVLCRRGGGAWQRLPEASGRNDSALGDLTHLRIYSPFTEEPQKGFVPGTGK